MSNFKDDPEHTQDSPSTNTTTIHFDEDSKQQSVLTPLGDQGDGA
jgi:hypothetical protein